MQNRLHLDINAVLFYLQRWIKHMASVYLQLKMLQIFEFHYNYTKILNYNYNCHYMKMCH